MWQPKVKVYEVSACELAYESARDWAAWDKQPRTASEPTGGNAVMRGARPWLWLDRGSLVSRHSASTRLEGRIDVSWERVSFAPGCRDDDGRKRRLDAGERRHDGSEE
ncbi:hypothetical protein CDD83_922 [Cordyceps sp. RAO-2017]|nr:hypothetical protein CDD83_922 [Cordyceps sp. RAO-2017]